MVLAIRCHGQFTGFRYLHYTQVNGFGNILDFDKGSDLKNVNNIVLDLSTTGLSLPSRVQ